MSSTNTTSFLPGGGIRITFLFFLCVCNFPSIYPYVELEDVLAEKVSSQVAITFCSFSEESVLAAIIVLPVPVSPVKKIGWSKLMFFSRNHE